MLDAFCYSGGFGLHAARAGAASVLGVDQSEPALALARENAELNGLDNLEFVRGDVFDGAGRTGGAAASVSAWWCSIRRSSRATGGPWTRRCAATGGLQTLALRLLEPDGFLVTCCCSGLITTDMLEELLAQLAAEEKRDIQILQRRGPSAGPPRLGVVPGIALSQVSRHPGPLKSLERNVCQ